MSTGRHQPLAPNRVRSEEIFYRLVLSPTRIAEEFQIFCRTNRKDISKHESHLLVFSTEQGGELWLRSQRPLSQIAPSTEIEHDMVFLQNPTSKMSSELFDPDVVLSLHRPAAPSKLNQSARFKGSIVHNNDTRDRDNFASIQGAVPDEQPVMIDLTGDSDSDEVSGLPAPTCPAPTCLWPPQ